MIVIDASVLVEAVLRPHKNLRLVNKVLDYHVVHAPALVDFEVLNAIRNSVLRKEITANEGRNALTVYSLVNLEKHVFDEPEISAVWQLRNEITPYDAAYVVLAQTLGLPLFTLDIRLSRAASKYVRIHLPPDPLD